MIRSSDIGGLFAELLFPMTSQKEKLKMIQMEF